ncbi:MAG: DUF192 domain-containing protein [Hyphomicrobiales bacterium]|jgi:uncharacterized membrane protein (UPF0127 family)|nr:DUF192 domain-containing protein [Hyphomicrobiales bacterium]
MTGFFRSSVPHALRGAFRLRLSLLSALLLCLTSVTQPVRAADLQPLEIVTKTGVRMFSVEMAVTDEQRAKGLMYRKELADGRGMLFDFTPEQSISMWMKNTYISLDMIFIGADGRVTRVAENTEPESTRIVSSGGPAKAVLEVIAGTARRYGIAPGDQVVHPLFTKR